MSEKECPYCGETIKLQAVKCRYCHTMLNETQTPSQPATVDKVDNALAKTSDALSKFGTVCIYLLTLPIVAFFIWGINGALIAFGIGVLAIIGSISKWKADK